LALTTGAMRGLPGLLTLVGLAACSSNDRGLPRPDPFDGPNADVMEVAGGSDAGRREPRDDTALLPPEPEGTREPAAPSEPPALDPSLEPEAPRGPPGPPAQVGCADGTREGFTDLGRWRDIAGCAGGFRMAGLQGPRTYVPQCNREAGNTGANPSGVGCSVADLCAQGWQVCEDSAALALRAPGGCEEAIPEGFALFFLVRAGASPGGVCAPGSGWQNDLHGCGSFGMPAHETCAPLDRRLSFSTCQATAGIWSCGDADSHLQETALVTKAGPALGGVLCCREQ
jgi:hypothetical protein